MTESAVNDSISRLCKIWATSVVSLLESIGGTASVTTSEPKAAEREAQQIIASGVCARFVGEASLRGELALCAEKAAALALAQIFASEPLNSLAEFGREQQEVFLEFARQAAALAATAWKEQAQEDVAISFHSATEPPFAPAMETTLEIHGERFPSIELRLVLNQEICDALSKRIREQAEMQEEALQESEGGEEIARRETSTDALPANLDLLLDVELEATIRFGEREMLLKEIYSLMPGTVIELDQMINEPAQLLVAGRTVAWGEIVVVDGNFGLRVTEVASKGQRVEMVQL